MDSPFLKRFKSIVSQTKALPFDLPTVDNRIEKLAAYNVFLQQDIGKHAKEAGVIAHEKVIELVEDFLLVKEISGSEEEREFYKNFNADSFIARLITKRPFSFQGSNDATSLLRVPSIGARRRDWKKDRLAGHLLLPDYLSYEEMQISGLLGVSTPTLFINNGRKDNRGVQRCYKDFTEYGIIIGLVGARFEVEGRMEHQHMICDPEMCVKENGYGVESFTYETTNERRIHDHLLLEIWAKFYESSTFLNQATGHTHHYFPSYNEAFKGSTCFHPIYHLSRKTGFNDPVFLNLPIYKKRMQILAETLLMEANFQGENHNKDVFLHIVGFGLERWRIDRQQVYWIFDEFVRAASTLRIPRVAHLHFSRFPLSCYVRLPTGKITATGSGRIICVGISNRELADPIFGAEHELLLVTTFPWNSNAFPGNEYWLGDLATSTQAAAACASTIPQLLNPLTNDFYNNIRIYSPSKQN